MKLKKNPNSDLNRNQGLYFITGLMMVLALAYVALEWKTYDDYTYNPLALNVEDPLDEMVPLIDIKLPPPPPPPPVATPEIDIVDDDDPVEETVIQSTESNEEVAVLTFDDIPEVEDEVPDEVDFIVIEEVPVFPGCENSTNKRNCFQDMMQKHIKKHFRYPESAQNLGIQGRVSTMFIIQKDGSIGAVRMKGPAKSLENEAARILSKLPKMTPGKQRGTPVRVPFSIPINFQLQ